MSLYKSYLFDINHALKELIITDNQKNIIDTEEGFRKWISITKKVQEINSTMFFIGNGASAMMASHMAADSCKNGDFKSMAFNDTALLTAVSNDISYEQSFAMPLQRFASSNDVLVSISSSGNSPNIVEALKVANKLGCTIITLSGMKEDNVSRELGALNFYIPSQSYGIVECSHQVLLHCWLDRFMGMEGNNNGF